MKLTPKIPTTRYSEAIKEFYKTADPGKSMEDIDKLLAKYDTKLLTLMNMLWHKYGSHPLVALKKIISEEEYSKGKMHWETHQPSLIGSKSNNTHWDEFKTKIDQENDKFFQALQDFVKAIPNNLPIFQANDRAVKDDEEEEEEEEEEGNEEEGYQSRTFLKRRSPSADVVIQEHLPTKRPSTNGVEQDMYRCWTNIEKDKKTDEVIKLHEEYHLQKRTYSLSLPSLPPHLVLIHVTVDQEHICKNDPTCWAVLQISKAKRNGKPMFERGFFEFGKKGKNDDNSEYVVPSIFKVEVEWNCPFFPQSNLYVPASFLEMMPTKFKYEVELPLQCELIPNETLQTAGISDCTADIAVMLPTNYAMMELFLLNAAQMAVHIKKEESMESFEIIEDVTCAKLQDTLTEIVTFANYPNLVQNAAKETTVQHDDNCEPKSKIQKHSNP
jgi:hypothetical protein